MVVENGRISDFKGLVTLTLDRVILHTIMHHSSTSTYIPNFIEIEDTLWTDGHLRPTLLGGLGEVDLKIIQLKRLLITLAVSVCRHYLSCETLCFCQRQSRRRHYIFVCPSAAFVRTFVRTDLVTTISHERVERSQ